MGYYTNLVDSNIFVKKENFQSIYEKMCELNNYDELKRGRSFGIENDDQKDDKWNPNKWFSWMPYDYPDHYKTMDEILVNVGFETTYDKDGNLIGLGYYNKTGNEDYFLECFAGYVEDGNYVQFKGEEDTDYYRFVFSNGRMIRQVGNVSIKWEHEHVYEFGKMSDHDQAMAKWRDEFNEKIKAGEIKNG
jgi:hypothetical protein